MEGPPKARIMVGVDDGYGAAAAFRDRLGLQPFAARPIHGRRQAKPASHNHNRGRAAIPAQRMRGPGVVGITKRILVWAACLDLPAARKLHEGTTRLAGMICAPSVMVLVHHQSVEFLCAVDECGTDQDIRQKSFKPHGVRLAGNWLPRPLHHLHGGGVVEFLHGRRRQTDGRDAVMGSV
jgi:hypothetical protein